MAREEGSSLASLVTSLQSPPKVLGSMDWSAIEGSVTSEFVPSHSDSWYSLAVHASQVHLGMSEVQSLGSGQHLALRDNPSSSSACPRLHSVP